MREPTASVITRSANETRAVGHALGESIRRMTSHPIVIALSGELGAGKTTFVGGLLSALGVTGPIRSPTYTLIEPYERSDRALYHLDLYRLADASEVDGLALRDLLMPGAVLLVEWPERGANHLPAVDLAVMLEYEGDTGRRISAMAHTRIGEDLAVALRNSSVSV